MAARAERGFGLIEAMVTILIILFMSLAIFTVMGSSEAHKRSSTSVSDADQEGNYAVYMLDKAIRSAGSGFREGQATTYGCPLNVARNSNQWLPMQSASTNMPALFNQLNTDVGGTYRVAPVVIDSGGSSVAAGQPASDALIVMSGTSGFAEYPTPFIEVPTTTASTGQLNLLSTVGFNPNDILLLAQPTATTGAMLPCVVTEVAGTGTWPVDSQGIPTNAGNSNPLLPLAGNYFAAGSPALSIPLTSLAQNSTVMDLGNELTDGHPNFQLFAIAPSATGNTSATGSLNSTLWSYDLLQFGNTGNTNQAIAVADGVYQMRALYGVSSSAACSGTGCPITSWEDPSSANWNIASLMAGTAAANIKLYQIKAIRLGLIMRTALPEQQTSAASTPVQLTTVTLFNNLLPAGGTASPYTRTFNLPGETNYRYRAIEVTIPVRNNLF